jgi:hypothetical protein
MEHNGNQTPLLPSPKFIQTENLQTPWKCHRCHICFSSRKNLDLHIEEKKTLSYVNPYVKLPQQRLLCKDCNTRFDTTQGLKQHIGKKHKKEKSSVCIYCSKSFIHKYAVKFHVNQVHTKKTRAQCRYCHKSFYNVYVMKIHSKKCKSRFPQVNINDYK